MINLLKTIARQNKKKGFTLLELLIIITLIALLGAAVFILLNPMNQLKKAHDAKRKNDLDKLKKAFEEYYNDKGCYPLPEEICYPGLIQNTCEGVGVSRRVRSKICYICGNEREPANFANFKPYLEKLPCDPEHPRKKYLYEVEMKNCSSGPGADCQSYDCSSSTQCPSWYRIYSDLGILFDKNAEELGCLGGGCGLAPTPAAYASLKPYGYDYGVSSPNISLEKTSLFYCCDGSTPPRCNGCGNSFLECYNNQTACPNKNQISADSSCLGQCR